LTSVFPEVNLRGVRTIGIMTRNKIIPYDPKLKALARTLRKNMTHAEVLLWNKIRRKSLGYQFHRQVPLNKYIVDFYCHELMLVIELDGKYHDYLEVNINDYKRQKKVESFGVQFLRFENKEVKKDVDSVVQVIEDWIKINE
jgi:very-short-patch-repair endonuclease